MISDMRPDINDFENNHSDNENNYTKIHSLINFFRNVLRMVFEHPLVLVPSADALLTEFNATTSSVSYETFSL